jgi:hypothetical protein
MERMEEKVAAHGATLSHMNERLGSIESRLLDIESRLSGPKHRILAVGGVLGLLMTLYKFL